MKGSALPNIVYIPGLLCTGEIFEDVAARVANRAGLEATILTPPREARWDDFIDALGRQLPERCVLVGLSMGAYAALGLWRRSPERIAGLALVSGSARADAEDARARRARMADAAREKGIETVCERMAPALFAAPGEGGEDAAARLRQRFVAMGARVGAETFAAHQSALSERPDARGFLSEIDVPLAAITGDEDQLTPPALGRELADAAPRGRFVGVPRAGHLAPWEQPDDIANAIASLVAECRVAA